MPRFGIEPEIFKGINRAIANKLRIEVDYRSVNAPNKDGRIITPSCDSALWSALACPSFIVKNQHFGFCAHTICGRGG